VIDLLVAGVVCGAVAFLCYGWWRITGPLDEMRQAKEERRD
jgi:hypothetical protein